MNRRPDDPKDDASPPDLDLARLADWLAGRHPAAARVRSARLIAGGKSNLTYEISDGTGSWILRRPPLGHVLETAHDMSREYRVMSALDGTGVPVPSTYALCTDQQVLGAPFYIMQNVAGTPYRSAAELATLGPRRVRQISIRLVDTLAKLHQVDSVSVGLSGFGRPAGFLRRQLRRWAGQLEASQTRPLPAAAELHRLLSADTPGESAPGIVHGDYRLDNILLDRCDSVAAIIDWEMATLGDPLTDLALLLVYQRLARLPGGSAIADAASAPGFITESETIRRYADRTSRDLDRLDFYLGLASYKLVAVLEGIHFRYVHGQTVGRGFDQIGALSEPLLEATLASLKG